MVTTEYCEGVLDMDDRSSPGFFAIAAFVGSQAFGCIAALTASTIHLLTCLVAFANSGLVGFVLTCFLPVISEAYWLFRLGPTSVYGIVVLVWLALFILPWVGILVASILQKQ